MRFPKLSGTLNNCALHAITPELREQINNLGHNRASIPPAFRGNYEFLKTQFARYYGLDPAKFSWRHFSRLLAPYNTFDFQILMGPVLRLFMQQQITMLDMQIRENQAMMRIFAPTKSKDSYAQEMTSINPSGRYATMGADELFHFVAKPLGFQVAYSQPGLNELVSNDELENPLATINLYHEGVGEGAEHWERTPPGTERIDDEPSSELTAIISLFRQGSELITRFGIDLLKKYVLARANNNQEEMQRISLAAKQIESSNVFLSTESKVAVKARLGPRICQETLEFLDFDPARLPEVPRALKSPLNGANAEILVLLNELEKKINAIGKHHPNAKNVALYLHAQLLYLTETTFNKPNVTKKEIIYYQSRINQEIAHARPVLQRDLGWGEYLSNLATNIANILVKLLTFGLVPSLFKPIKSEAVRDIEAFESNINRQQKKTGK